MNSHTVPQKLLEQFTYSDTETKSKRLWCYEKGRPPRKKVAPRSATAHDRFYADPDNPKKEEEIEQRLKRDFEDPVNEFLELLSYSTYILTRSHMTLLARYVTVQFNRAMARRKAAKPLLLSRVEALTSLVADREQLSHMAVAFAAEYEKSGQPLFQPPIDLLKAEIENQIKSLSEEGAEQRAYVQSLENMMNYSDDGLQNGEWRIIRSTTEDPFVIGDSPVVTWTRLANNQLNFGEGFSKPTVEVFLPVGPTTCLHILPAVERTSRIVTPTTAEVNKAQAAFAVRHCFTNRHSENLDQLLQKSFGLVKIGVNGFSLAHRDAKPEFVDIFMSNLGPLAQALAAQRLRRAANEQPNKL